MTVGDDDTRGKTPRGMIDRIYLEFHLTLLHTKYRSFRPCGFREDFKCFSHYKPMTDEVRNNTMIKIRLIEVNNYTMDNKPCYEVSNGIMNDNHAVTSVRVPWLATML